MDSVRSLTMYSTPRLRTFDDVEEDYADHEIFNCGEFYSCGGLNMYGFGLVMGLWFFASVVLIECIYGSESVLLGPNSSFLLEPSSIFVKSIKVKEQDYSKAGLQLYGFYGSPPLNRFINWSDSRVLPVSQNRYKAGLRFSGWPYYLNQGSSMNISYSVTPKGSAVQLVIHEGMRGISDSSLEESAFRDTAWSWNLIQGSGMIKLEISKSSNYYLAVHNLKRTDVEVELNIDVRAVLYDTKQSFYNCTFSNGECTFNAMSLVGNSVVITSPALSQGDTIEDAWYITYSYQHRLIAYVIATGLVICFMLAAVQFCNRLQCCGAHLRRVLADKYDNGSCNKPFMNDDADLEEFVGDDGEARNRRCVCAICYDAPIDCFFLPCGHCVSCYQCGTKIKRVVGSCPICRHKMKKVKRICTA